MKKFNSETLQALAEAEEISAHPENFEAFYSAADLIIRCNEIQKDFAPIDYMDNSDLPEEFVQELLVAKNAPTEPFEFEDENKLITRR